MKKYIKRLLSVTLSMILMLSLCVPAFGADTSSAEYQFFSLLNKSATGLTDAFSTGTSTGNWTAAKDQLLSFYKTKFGGLSWANYSGGNNGTAVTAMNDTIIFADHERYLSKQTVTTTLQQISIPLSAGQVQANYILAVLKHNDSSGVCIYSKEYGSSYAPVLTVNYSDGSSQDFSVSADTYIRATGYGQSNSYSTSNYGSSTTLWAMHRADTSNNMPYSNDEMRTFVRFNYSANGKSISSAAIKVYAQVKNPGSGSPASGTTLELMAFSPYVTSWTESSFTWKTLADSNSICFYSWNGLGGVIWNETLYGKSYTNLHVPNEYLNAASRFYEECALCLTGNYTKAKEMILRFADQTYDVIKNGTTTSGGFPTINRPIEPANRSMVFPYIYRTLLANNALSAEENYKLLRWYYQDIQFLYKEKTGNIFLNGGSSPNTTTNSYKDNYGAWHITGFYNTFAFFGEFTESSSWQQMFESRLSLIAGGFVNSDGSYTEVTFGYPGAVIGWYANMLSYMNSGGYSSSASTLLKQNLIRLVKYMLDCSYPSGYLPQYGDGGRASITSVINTLLSIGGISSTDSKQLKNLLWYSTNGSQGEKPDTTAYYPDSKIVTDRTGWSSSDSMFFMNAKAGGVHTHHDALAILLYANGRNLLIDTGTLTYDSTNEGYDLKSRTNTHNTIEVDSTGQRVTGGSVRDGYDGSAENIRQYSNAMAATTRAYTTSNTNATHYRNATFLKEYGGMLLVSDWVKSTNSSSHTCTQNWHTGQGSNPTTATTIGRFSGNTWGYTNFSSGANLMIAQATPNNDGNNTISAATPLGNDETSSNQKSNYFEFTQSGKNVTFNTAIANYSGTSMGIRTMKLDTGVKDNVASAMQVQRFNNSSLSTLTDEITYYNSFEDSPGERTIQRRQDSNNQYFMFKTNAGNALFHVRLDETVDMLSLTNGSKLDTYLSSTSSSNEENPMARISTSAKVTDISAKYDVSTGVVSIETSDQNVINGITKVTVEFQQFGSITAVTLNGTTLTDNVSISGKTVVLGSESLFFDFTNDGTAQSRYSSSAYGSGAYNYDNGAWENRVGDLSYLNSGIGTMTAQVTNADGYNGFQYTYVQTKIPNNNTPKNYLDYNMANAEVIQVRAMFHGVSSSGSTYAQALTGANTGSAYDYKYSEAKTLPFTADQYIVFNIPVSSAQKSAGTTNVLRVGFNNLTQTSSSAYIVFDYIYVGKKSQAPNRAFDDYTAVTLSYNTNGATSETPSSTTFAVNASSVSVASAPTRAYTILYDADGGSPAPGTQTAYYTFNGWKSSRTSQTVTGTSTTPAVLLGTTGGEVNEFEDVILIAQWSPASVNLASVITKTGYVFAGWKCSADDIVRSAGSSYTPEINVTMTAQWTTAYSVHFNGNGATEGSMSDQAFVYGTAQSLTANTFGRKFSVTYNTEGGTAVSNSTATSAFAGWATSATGPANYSDKQSVSNLTDAAGSTVQLYAVWTAGSVTLPTTIRTGYTLDGWYSGSTKAGNAGESYTPTANTALTAKWEVITYTVRFCNYDGTVLQSSGYEYGEIPVYSGETPSKPATAQYSYTFSGWSPAITAVTGGVTYTAQYTGTLNSYTVTWKNDDGTVLETDQNVNYGTVPSYDGAAPAKPADAQYTYIFSGWSPDVSAISGDTVYTAQFISRVKKYTVTWLDSSGTTLRIDRNIPYGTMPEYTGTTPSKDPDAHYIYTFSSWTPEITEVTGNVTYTASYATELQQYSVTFADANGMELQSETLAYGETPIYKGDTPAKMYDDTNHYIFSGWSPEIETVTQNAVYAAQFSAQQHDLTYRSSGAAHYGVCSCGYQTQAEQHIPGADGKCTLCGANTAIFYMDYGDITITESGASGYDVNGDPISVGLLESYTVTQLNPSQKADHALNVVSGTHTVILDNISIERTGMNAYAVSVQGTAEATFIITGENHITSGVYRAGLDIAINAAAILEGDGTLYAQSPLQAGIGGGNGKSNGTLIINSGDIYATGGINGYSAGIGGGTSGKGGNITINGGFVVAQGGALGSGIGGGNGFAGGNITINGGTVTATGGQGGAGIGGGYTANGGMIVINGGTVKATAGTGAESIGNGYKCTTDFAGVHNSDGDTVSLIVIDTGDADRVYFNGIDTAALRHHPDDNNYYFYACSTSAVTAYDRENVAFFIGADLTQTNPYVSSSIRKGEYLLTGDMNSVTADGFTFANGKLIYCGKVIDRASAGLLGDVNLDGNVDGEDSVMVNCIIVGLLTQANLEPIQYAAADYDTDGEITSADAALLEEAGLLGTVSTLNVQQDTAQTTEIEEQEPAVFIKIENFFTAVVSKISDIFG